MDREKAIALMRNEAGRLAETVSDRDGVVVLRLFARNDLARRALHDQKITIRYFPFVIGRAEESDSPLLDRPDISINESRPYRISREQIRFERRGDQIYAVDPGSRYGSAINGRPLGAARSGPMAIPLSFGRHEIEMGNPADPYTLTAVVENDRGEVRNHELVLFRDRYLPVPDLYARLYRHVRSVFETFFANGRRGVEEALPLVASVLEHPQIIDPLYHYSAVPQVHGDVMVYHSLNTMIYTIKLSRAIPLPVEDLTGMALAALFHDMGMFDIPAEIIEKKDVLSEDEFAIVKSHPVKGYRLLVDLPDLLSLVPAVTLSHHERIDGSGYPHGLRDISDYIELIAIVDFFEAVTHYRPQRGPLTPHEGMRSLIDLKRNIFSSEMVKTFLNAFSLFPVHSVVRINSGEVGQVIETHWETIFRPVIRVFFDRYGNAVVGNIILDLAKEEHCYIVKDISDRVFVDHYFRLDDV